MLLGYSAALSLSAVVLNRGAAGAVRWDHWSGAAVWIAVFSIAHRQTTRWLPGRDPFLLPTAALLSGWGLLTVWSLQPEFGLRQTFWLAVCGGIMIAALRLPSDLGFLRRYKTVWLSGSLLLVALTLWLGVNPLGYGPRMWLGCCGIYLQPSEPLKLLLIAYLAAEMADRRMLLSLGTPARGEKPVEALLPLVATTLLMIGLAIALLAIQRDLGTASVFLFCYAAIIYVASQRRRALIYAGLGFLAAALIGNLVYDVASVRIQAWLDPWQDPSGGAFQIVQSLMAVASGGVVGRGPGLGSPHLVPVAHSDLVFAAVAEQSGLIGVLGMLGLIGLICGRGLLTAIRSPDSYRRYLAAGLVTYLVGQSLLIITGTLRVLPLTGITLPFVSYGGSSLLVSMAALALLLIISKPVRERSAGFEPKPYLQLALVLEAGILVSAAAAGWWAVGRSPDLLSRTDNPRRAVSDRYVRRGAILDRNLDPIVESSGEIGEINRQTNYPALSSIVGYTNPTYGQSGLEAALDKILRGLEGNSYTQVLWDQLINGQPPPGLDVRLAVDLDLQRRADELLEGQKGALVLLNAASGEILAMASHPDFDSNRLEKDWPALVVDPDSPLLNRATFGRYPAGGLDALFPNGIGDLGVAPTPRLRLETGDLEGEPDSLDGYSPLQMALAAAAVTADGIRPAPQLTMAVDDPEKGWTPLAALSSPGRVFSSEEAQRLAGKYAVPGKAYWQAVEVVSRDQGSPVTWLLGGALPGSQGVPLAIALAIEAEEPGLAEQIAREMLSP